MARPSDPQAMTPRKPGRTRTAPPQLSHDLHGLEGCDAAADRDQHLFVS